MRRKGSAKSDGYSSFSSGWKLNFRREGNVQVKPMTTPKVAEPFFVRKQFTTLEEKEKKYCSIKVYARY